MLCGILLVVHRSDSSTSYSRGIRWFASPEVCRMSNALYYVKREKCKVNDVIYPCGCEASAIILDNKNIEIGIFNGGTSVR